MALCLLGGGADLCSPLIVVETEVALYAGSTADDAVLVIEDLLRLGFLTTIHRYFFRYFAFHSAFRFCQMFVGSYLFFR